MSKSKQWKKVDFREAVMAIVNGDDVEYMGVHEAWQPVKMHRLQEFPANFQHIWNLFNYHWRIREQQ
jgi:hypothetical protein